MTTYQLNKLKSEVITLTEFMSAQTEIENMARPVSLFPSIDKRKIKKQVIKD